MNKNNTDFRQTRSTENTEECLVLRQIIPEDNAALAHIIRSSIEALDLPSEGTAHGDPTTDDLYALFKREKSVYWVAMEQGTIQGGCGIFPSEGLPEGCGELVRFFLRPEARGKGYGHLLIEQSIDSARKMGYSQIYLESFPSMEAAVHLYRQYGFTLLSAPLGNTGHHACNVWMIKHL